MIEYDMARKATEREDNLVMYPFSLDTLLNYRGNYLFAHHSLARGAISKPGVGTRRTSQTWHLRSSASTLCSVLYLQSSHHHRLR